MQRKTKQPPDAPPPKRWRVQFGPDGRGIIITDPDGKVWTRPPDVPDGMFSMTQRICADHGITRADFDFPPTQLWKE